MLLLLTPVAGPVLLDVVWYHHLLWGVSYLTLSFPCPCLSSQTIVVENKKQLDKYTGISRSLPKLKALVVWDATMEEIATAAATADCPTVHHRLPQRGYAVPR